MANIRKIKKVLKSHPTLEGAGVHLKRAFGFHQLNQLDPFLLFDDFHGKDEDKYIKGFPWHPHRGIETITYMLHGEVEHGDSMGNRGVIHAGDVQWMTAGSGVIHQEMPKGNENGEMWGFQLWANLPASHKMMAPRYREIKDTEIPVKVFDNGISIKVICGRVDGVHGPVKDVVIDPEYLDVSLPSHVVFKHRVSPGYTVFAYTIEGDACFEQGCDPFDYDVESEKYFEMERDSYIGPENLVVFDDGDELVIATRDNPARFLLVSGKPLKEPVAWYGPIVMNTQEELKTAFKEFRNGTFLK